MAKTLFNEYSFPDEDQDPYFKTLSSFFGQLDVAIWNNRMRSNLILAGGGSISFNSTTSLLTWSDDFGLKHLYSGFLNEFRFGPDNLTREASILEGQVLYGQIPSQVSQGQVKNLLVADQLPSGDNNFVLAWRYNNSVYFQNGIIL